MSAEPTGAMLLASGLMVSTFVVVRLHLRVPLWLQAVSRIVVLVLLTTLMRRIIGSPLQPRFGVGDAGFQFWKQVIEVGWWSIVAKVAVDFTRLLVVLENRPRETRIVSDLLAGAIYVATGLAVINFAFGVPIRGLLATSGVIAIVLGLALQSTLSDVFSGIAVGLERPYKAGDLLWVEGGIEGHVLQVNWRSTQIATSEDNIAVVPNSIIAKSRLVNRSAPSPRRGDNVTVSLSASVPPERCIAALTTATQGCRIIVSAPAPSVGCTGLRGDGVSYEVTFSVASSDLLAAARTELLEQIHRHLRHAGIPLAVAGMAAMPQSPVPTISQLLEQSELFGLIAAPEREALAARFSQHAIAAGETLIREAEQPEALFLLASGVVEITRKASDGPRVVYRLSPGECLGAIGMITGKASMATGTALTPLEVWRLDREDIGKATRASPELARELQALAARGEARIRSDAALGAAAEGGQPEMFLSRLNNFLHRLAS